MKLVRPHYDIWIQKPYVDGIYKQIERAGRICYSPDTEVLTNSGWKRIDNLLESDKVVSYNPDCNTIIYDCPNLVVRDYDDDMIEINHSQIKICVTKDHRIYQSVPEKRDYTFMRASQLAGIEKIPHSKQCRFRIPKYFIGAKRDVNIRIPSIIYSKDIKNGSRPSSTVTINIPCNEDFMVIAGAFISEGHTYHGESHGTGSYCQITQDEGSELYSKVITALTNLKWNFKIYNDPRKSQIKWIRFGTNQCWVMAFDDLFGKGSKNKHFPIWFRVLPDEYLKILISIMYLGDGSHSTTRNEKYLSISKRLLDEVQEVFILLGKNGTSNYNKEISQMCYFEETHRDSWIVSRDKHIDINPYKGKVYCTSTKSGIICIRYKGKTCWCGNCYRSESNITEESAKPFVDMLINSEHYSVLEHGTVYLKVPYKDAFCVLPSEFNWVIENYGNNPYSEVRLQDSHFYITTNYRVLIEHNWLNDLEYLCKPTEYHEKRVTVHFILSRSIAQEFTRHRVFSYSMESQRYCNYSKNKFGNEITFILPPWLDWNEQVIHYGDFERSGSGSVDSGVFINSLLNSEKSYFALLHEGWKPQQAREVLHNACKTELVMTGFISQWKDFFRQRDDVKAHPQARELASPLHVEFITRKYLEK